MRDEDCRPVGQDIVDCRVRRFATLLVDPPWPANIWAGWKGPEKRKVHYPTLPLRDIRRLPIKRLARPNAHIYLWVVNGLVEAGYDLLRAWGFECKTHLVWCKTTRDGSISRSGMGNYFRRANELCLFGVRGKAPTLRPARSQADVILARRREHSRKPDELYDIIERCSPAPRLELFARYPRCAWYQWGNQINERLFTAPPAGDNAPLPTTLVYTSKERHLIYRSRVRTSSL